MLIEGAIGGGKWGRAAGDEEVKKEKDAGRGGVGETRRGGGGRGIEG